MTPNENELLGAADEYVPPYVALVESGELRRRVEALHELLRDCVICPRRCRADRLSGKTGFCRVGSGLSVSSYGPHFGEEAPLVGCGGSGTIFLTGCNLDCIYCQNHEISHPRSRPQEVTSREQFVRMMLSLHMRGCHNINFVTPTHQVAAIMDAVEKAVEAGLRLPIVYNCGGYESVEVLRLLDGIVDIYMPDMKYGDNEAGRYSGVHDYWDQCREAVREMHRQVGDLKLALAPECPGRSIAVRGLLVRHLVLPNGLARTAEVARFLAEEISLNTYVNIMGQYRPAFQAYSEPLLSRCPTPEEIRAAREITREAGLWRLDKG